MILVKYWFIVLERTDSSEINLLFSISIDLLVFKSLLLKNGFIVFQNFLLSFISLTLIFSKYSFFVFLKRFTEKLCYFLLLSYVLVVRFLLKTFFNLERCMIALRSCFVIKGLLLNLRIFFFTGAWAFRTCRKIFSNKE